MPVFDHRRDPSERTGRDVSRAGTTVPARSAGPLPKLLAAQSTAGNTAVVQMLRQGGHRFAQHAHGAGRGHGASTGAGSGARAAAPVQRVAKESVQQPAAEERSAEVPDLPRELVDAIGRARSAAERREVLVRMRDYILERFNDLHIFGALSEEQTGLLAQLYQRVHVTYSHVRTGAMAHTQELLGQATGDRIDAAPIVITVYRAAFEGGAAQLYSTLRHELIHAVQRSMVPDEGQASATDDVMYEDLYEAGTGVPTRNTLQLPLQEIETHVWELTHAGETGVDAGYRADTVTYLLQYAESLTQGVGGATYEQFAYWVNYLLKAVGMLESAAGAVSDAQSVRRIQRAAAELRAAIDNRSGSGGGSGARGGRKRSGGSGSGSGKRSGGSGSGGRRRSGRTAA
ncbi:hypothetical protein J7I94_06975 [Streptomyces sp. ISL-12]|uniref:hypothetical protein n=1 Tax=Streptomyces sp. ISL-12 TaxID=2819177 RepID=UPI001BE7A928|nr:hypothetical protein [Streptomyces sp. ISL-12]MBT2410301.1 hypothetical protein [Streptomyces sp. ISL-12]